MAHNIHIPWTILSSQFKFSTTPRKHNGETNLYPRFLPKQGSELMHFSRVFAQTIASFSATERSKYPNPITPPEPDEIIISESTAKKISKTVTHYRTTNNHLRPADCTEPRERSWFACSCPLSLPGRKMSIWISELDCERITCDDCCCHTRNHTETCELAKTLLLYGEMETLLKIASHPDVRLESRWNVPWRCGGVFGISQLMRCALTSYIFFNVVYLHTETWETESKEKWMAERKRTGLMVEEDEVDYRKMVSWEKVLSRCTGKQRYDVHTFPHRLFFGVSEPNHDAYGWNRGLACGRNRKHSSLESKEERRRREKYLPVSEDVAIVLFYLRVKGCPTEIGLEILAYADFKPERRLPIANDPLDSRNREELRKYLSWCWKVLVWCDVLMTASGSRIGWIYEVTDVIRELWGIRGGNEKLFRWRNIDEEIEEDADWSVLQLL